MSRGTPRRWLKKAARAESQLLEVAVPVSATATATFETTPIQGQGADGSPLVRDSLGVRPATWGEIYEHRAEFRAMGHNVGGMDAVAARSRGDGDTQAAREDVAAIFGPDPHGIATPDTLAEIQAIAAEQAAIEAAERQRIALEEQDRTLSDLRPNRPYTDPEPTTADLRAAPVPVRSSVPLPGADLPRRMAALEYPSPRSATRDHYAAVMRRVGEYTGTSTDLEQPATWYWLPGLRSSDLPISWIWQREPVLALPAGGRS